MIYTVITSKSAEDVIKKWKITQEQVSVILRLG